MRCPGREEELELARRMMGEDAPESALARGVVTPVLEASTLSRLRGELQGITVRDELVAYLVDVVRTTREHESVLVGAGPRATQSLLLAARALAALEGRDFVTPDDIKFLAVPVLEHRLILRPEFEVEGTTVVEVVQQVLERVSVPR
jgi:MoxR-like ATPase